MKPSRIAIPVLALFVLQTARASPFLVTNTLDSGAGSLSHAIAQANAAVGTNTIVFNILPLDGTVKTIFVTNQLPLITQAVIIDGYTQDPTHSHTNTLANADDAVLLIELNGTNMSGGEGLTIGSGSPASGSVVRGLVINNFAAAAINSQNGNVRGVVIEGNFIGTDPSGKLARGNARLAPQQAVVILDNPGDRIGGTSAGARNIISGNVRGGIQTGASGNNLIQGNFIGVDATGTNALGNGVGGPYHGVLIQGSSDVVGGTNAGARNVISGNGGNGVVVNQAQSARIQDVSIQGNYIGTDVNGIRLLPNGGIGVLVNDSTNVLIGGAVAVAGTPPGNLIAGNSSHGVSLGSPSSHGAFGARVQGNTITANQGDGVLIYGPSERDTVSSNSIFANGGLGIELLAGGNNSQSNPVITSVTTGGGNVTLGGSLQSGSNAVFRLEFFSNASCDGSGNGEGQVFLGSTNVTTGASGNASFLLTLINPAGHANFTTTATDTNGNTSAFSPCASVSGPCVINCTNIIVSTAPNQCGAVVNFFPSTSGNCGAVNCSPPSGSFFLKGTNTVTCTNASGANCSFTIAILDTVAPSITCSANITTNVPVTQSNAVVNFPAPVFTDNCGLASTNVSPPSGSVFPLGVTTVLCIATDTSGNTNTCSFTVTVTHTNHAPVLTAPANQTIDELTTLSVNASATDTDAPPNNVTIELVSGPSGLTVSPAGAIGWTPTETQGPSTNIVTLRAIDDGVPSMSSTQSFTVVVHEVNTAPVLTVPATQFVADGASLNTNVSMSDADVPTNTVTLQLLSFPTGLTMSPAGVVSWTPTPAQRPSTNTVAVRAFDNGSPSLSTTNSFVVIALAPLPPHLTVLNTNDSGSGSLRQAIADVGVSNISLITFASNVTGAITLTSGALIITNDMSIAGPGAKILAINGNNSNNAALNITKGSANISGLSVTNGGFNAVGCVHAAAGAALTLTDCDISHNANNGIINEGTLTAIRCTVSSNNSTTLGVGINNDSGGVAVIRNSTVSGNAGGVGARGAGIYNRGTLSVSNCTIANNAASFGGGIYIAGGTVTVSSSIIANNSGNGPDVFGAFVSGGYNLIGRTNGASGFTNGVNHDLAGSTAAPLDPLLGPLQDNGGATLTRALLPGSPAIDNGVASGLVIDQRGVARTIDFPGISNPAGGDGTDIGAFETDEPLLYIARAGNSLEVTWPSNAFHLERTFSLAPPISWQTISNGLITNGPLLVFPFTISASPPSQFFRLSLP